MVKKENKNKKGWLFPPGWKIKTINSIWVYLLVGLLLI